MPGPGQYGVPRSRSVNIRGGKVGKDPRVPKSLESHKFPGPGHYDPFTHQKNTFSETFTSDFQRTFNSNNIYPSKKRQKVKKRGYTFGKQQRGGKSLNTQLEESYRPGPGKYGVPKNDKKGRAIDFDYKSKRFMRSTNGQPGPGAYDISEARLHAKSKHKKGFSMGVKFY